MQILLERIGRNIFKVYLPVYVVELIFKIADFFLLENGVFITLHALWVMLGGFVFVYLYAKIVFALHDEV